MSEKTFILGQPDLRYPILAIAIGFVVLLIWSYRSQTQASTAVRLSCGILKATGFAILAFCLLEPLLKGMRPVPGENVFVLLADRSQSLSVRDPQKKKSRGDLLNSTLQSEQDWQVRLAQDFDVRRYWIGKKLEKVKSFEPSQFGDLESRLNTAISAVGNRLQTKPVAGILFFSDGNATDGLNQIANRESLPPVYPVVQGNDEEISDLEVGSISVSQTNFEAAPVRITATIHNRNASPQRVYTELTDEAGAVVDQQTHEIDKSKEVTFKIKPDAAGIRYYTVGVAYASDLEEIETEVTTSEGSEKNNFKNVVVDRGGGPYRVLYVSGRPNWEFKFLNRALDADREVQIIGLIRIAKKKPKFDFRRKGESTTSEFFKGFETDEDEAEQYFEPVLLRVGTEDEDELKGGFPKTAEALFRYDAIICDDVESKYFTFEQMNLIKRFVNERGGGFLMLGGQESFSEGEYSRTPVADLLPVYVSRKASGDGPSIEDPSSNLFRFRLSRTGKLQPWIRLRATESDEQARLSKMPNFASLNKVGGLKPGADELAFAGNPAGENHTALVVQNYGKGRSGAILIGDLWRWGLNRPDGEDSDLESAWRQAIRWLVADVPSRVEVDVVEPKNVLSDYRLRIVVRNEEFQPLDNADLTITVAGPDGEEHEITGFQSSSEPGVYEASHPATAEGNYLATVVAKNPDGTIIESRQAGWVYSPHTRELQRLTPNRQWLSELAKETGGELVVQSELDQFVKELPNRKLPRKETAIFPLWHQMAFFWIAIVCLAAEWGIRRVNGLP